MTLLLACGEKKTPTNEVNVVNLKEILNHAIFDIRYATPNNFTGEAVYTHPHAWLADSAAIALKAVEDELAERKLRLLIFDGYRPLSVQKRFWEILPDPTYVANPENGSRHNRGAAVDLAIATWDGTPLDMPTDFDDFTSKAAHSYDSLDTTVLANRSLLKSVMEKHGFIALESEWWHYDYHGWENYPILEIDLPKLENQD